MRDTVVHMTMAVAAATLPAACAISYSASPMEARVVDADSGQPLPDVIVVAHWALRFGLEGGDSADLQVLETVTDRDGRFAFPGWGPEGVPSAFPSGARMASTAPSLILFKRGYEPRWISNSVKSPGANASPASEWDGTRIALRRFEGDAAVYALALSSVLTGVSYGGCGWQRIPRMIVALNAEAERLRREGRVPHAAAQPSIAELEANEARNGCGSVRKFLEEHRQ